MVIYKKLKIYPVVCVKPAGLFALSGRLRREAKQTTELPFKRAREKQDQMWRNCEESKNPEIKY